jgi:hypothetical protein
MQSSKQVKANLTGGGMSGGGLTRDPAMGLPPGALFDDSLLPGSGPANFDASISSAEMVQILPTLPFGSSNICSYTLPATNGSSFWDLSSFRLLYTSTVTPVGTINKQSVTPLYPGLLAFQKLELRINSVNVSEEHGNILPFRAFADACLTCPFKKFSLAEDSNVLDFTDAISGPFEKSGICSPPVSRVFGTTYTDSNVTILENSLLVRNGNLFEMEIPLGLLHGMFRQEKMLSCANSIQLDLTQAALAYKYALNLTGEAIQETNISCVLFARKIIPTNIGLQLYNSALANAGMVARYRFPHFQTFVQYITAGQTSFAWNQVLTHRPQAIVAHFVPGFNLNNGQTGIHPFEQSQTAGANPIISSMYYTLGSTKYPRGPTQSHSFTTRTGSGGSALLDYSQYVKMSKQYREHGGESASQPLLSYNVISESGNLCIFFTDLTDNGDAFDHASVAPASGPMSINLTLASALSLTYAVSFTAVYGGYVDVAADGRVSTSW